jgi:Rrf2 family protein
MLSQKAKYALKALSYLAAGHGKGPMLIAEISRKKKIPLKFLENILLELKKEGLLDSKKGRGGGYYLVEPPAKVPLARVIRTIDGPIAMLPCVSLYFYKKCSDCIELQCGMNRVFSLARDATLKVLEKKTLLDII